jgi:hypothetical protein
MFKHNWGMWFVYYSSTLVIRPPWRYIVCFISSGHMHGTWQAMSSKMHMSSSLLHWTWCTATVKNPTLFQQQTHTIVIALLIRSSLEDCSLMLYAKLASGYIRSVPGYIFTYWVSDIVPQKLYQCFKKLWLFPGSVIWCQYYLKTDISSTDISCFIKYR